MNYCTSPFNRSNDHQLFEKQLTRHQIPSFYYKSLYQIAVQEKLRIDQAALTRHFKILSQKADVSRKRNPLNQREVLVELTQEAKNQLLLSPPKHHMKVKNRWRAFLSIAEQIRMIWFYWLN